MGFGGSISLSSSRKKTTIQRVPSTLGSEDIKPVALSYRDLAKKYLDSEPGLTGQEKTLYKRQAAETVAGSARGQRLRADATNRRYGYRGALEQSTQARIGQDEMAAQRDASIQLSLAEHTLREDDVVRRAALAAGFLWPAEQARGAGQVSGTREKTTSMSGTGSYSYP